MITVRLLLLSLLCFDKTIIVVTANNEQQQQQHSPTKFDHPVLDWLVSKKVGGFLLDSLVFQNGNLFTTSDIKEGDVVMKVSPEALIKPLIIEEEEEWEGSNECATARRLVYEYSHLKEKSFYWPYLQYVFEVFPHETVPIGWSKEGKKLIRDTVKNKKKNRVVLQPRDFGRDSYFLSCVDDYREYTENYIQYIQENEKKDDSNDDDDDDDNNDDNQLLSDLRKYTKDYIRFIKGKKEKEVDNSDKKPSSFEFDVELLETSWRIVASRGWNYVMVPVFDMINHRNYDALTGEGHNTDRYQGSQQNPLNLDVEGDYTVVAIRDIPAGSPLYNTYNQCHDVTCFGIDKQYVTSHVFKDYGFVEDYPHRFIFETTRDEDDEDVVVVEINSDRTVTWLGGHHKKKNYYFKELLEEELKRLKDNDDDTTTNIQQRIEQQQQSHKKNVVVVF